MKDNTDKTLILIGLVCLFLLLMHFLPPITLGGTTLRQVSILSDLSPHQPGAAHSLFASDSDADGASAKHGPHKGMGKGVWPKGVEPITDYSDGGACGMEHFYAMLDSLSQKKLTDRPLRIAYFADSYTEADILTADLREMLQAEYGGQGVGWVDAASDVNRFRLSLSISEHGMSEHMAMKKDGYDATKAGIAGRYAPFGGSASLSYKGVKTYPHATTWQVVRFYARPSSGLSITAELDSQQCAQSMAAGGIRESMLQSGKSVGSTALTLRGSGTAFGVSLEGHTGIVLDNFSMRSSSGLQLASIPDETLKTFQQLRHYDLVILSYGGNVATPSNQANQSEWYVKKMKNVIEKFKTCFPDASILLFGAPDFGFRQGSEIVTPESVKGLIGYQNELAAHAKVGFYNLLSAMGGDGTAGRMHEQGLVRDDLFHIDQKGGHYAAERIHKSINAGLKNYRRWKQQQ